MGPDEFAGVEIEAIEDAGGAERVDAIVVNGGRGARAVAAQLFGETDMICVRPGGGAGEQVVANDEFERSALFLSDGAGAGDGEGRPTETDGLAPELLRWVGGPVCFELSAEDDIAPAGAEEFWESGYGIGS